MVIGKNGLWSIMTKEEKVKDRVKDTLQTLVDCKLMNRRKGKYILNSCYRKKILERILGKYELEYSHKDKKFNQKVVWPILLEEIVYSPFFNQPRAVEDVESAIRMLYIFLNLENVVEK
jgi:hypothetical protein